MRNWPTHPMSQHNRFIAAMCDDMLETGRLDGPNASRVAEINRQINSKRDGSGNRPADNPLPTNE